MSHWLGSLLSSTIFPVVRLLFCFVTLCNFNDQQWALVQEQRRRQQGRLGRNVGWMVAMTQFFVLHLYEFSGCCNRRWGIFLRDACLFKLDKCVGNPYGGNKCYKLLWKDQEQVFIRGVPESLIEECEQLYLNLSCIVRGMSVKGFWHGTKAKLQIRWGLFASFLLNILHPEEIFHFWMTSCHSLAEKCYVTNFSQLGNFSPPILKSL